MHAIGYPLLAWLIVMWLAILGRHDLDNRRLPNRLTLVPVIAVLASAFTAPEAFGGVMVAALPYLVGQLTGGCGGGDLKLAAVLGGLAGDPGRALALVLVAATLTLASVALRPGWRGTGAVAHGPALGLAGVAVLPLTV